MKIPKEAIEEFRDIWKEKYGEEISFKDAEESARDLLEFYMFIFGEN